jgi:predicted glycosyltransferase
MRILVEVTHPAHVHFFRNAIRIWQEHGHQVAVTARDKEIATELLHLYGIEHTVLSGIGKSKLSLLSELVERDYKLWRFCRKFKPDILTGIGAIFASHVGFFLRKPAIVWTDTEHAILINNFALPFCSCICTPQSFCRDLGKKHLRYAGFHDLAYLHPDNFTPDKSVLKELSVSEGQKFVIMRFVRWQASHDIGHRGLSDEMKIKAVEEISKYAKIFISSEVPLNDFFEKYRIKISPERMHHVLYYSWMYFGESGTMASESAVLGTPAVNVATSAVLIGVFKEMEKAGLMFVQPDEHRALEKGLELIRNDKVKLQTQELAKKMICNKINVADFVVWFIENYPESERILRKEPDYQYKFR